MTEDTRGWQRMRKGLWIALAALVVILAVLIVPPFLSVSSYKSRITQLMSASLGRPVRLSSVEVRVLPRPGFLLTDLTVEEDPAYGAEPVLHANTVTASIRLLSLWRGRLEIGNISVDEASLNLVRTEAGRWNLDPLFRTAAHTQPGAGESGPNRLVKLPFLQATNSRINIKSGAEKLPFSLVNTDLSLWQDEPGDWRIRLRGQPARTDLSLDLADTGVVRLEGRVHDAPERRLMPLHLDLEWREAQLGQLARLVIGSDPGWRGDLTGELHLDGTADAAQVKTRLRAAGVHRAEFAPISPMDFDANCAFVYRFPNRAFDDLVCDSPLGNGRVHLAGNLPGGSGSPQLSVELFRVPVAVGLDALRTVRSGFGAGLEAKGTVSGKLAYSNVAPEESALKKSPNHFNGHTGKTHQAPLGPLTGSFTVEDFQLSGNGLKTPILVPKIVVEPVAASQENQPQALAASVSFPAGGVGPLAVTARVGLSGYQVTARGQASIPRARELANVVGLADAAGLDAIAGDPVVVDLSAEGPWLAVQRKPFGDLSSVGLLGSPPATDGSATDRFNGTVTFRNSNWKAEYLASYVEISQATLHLENGDLRWDPVAFTYGPVKGTANLDLPANCPPNRPCDPHFQLEFGNLDAAALQAAVLGAHEPGTMLSTLIARLRPSTAPAWPQLEGTVKAATLVLGPVTLQNATATLKVLPNGAEIAGLDAGLLGGFVHGSGTFHSPVNVQDKPAYTLEGHFEKLNPAEVCKQVELRCSGGDFEADGKIALTGFTDKDLAASVKGSLHFDWRRGAISGNQGGGRVLPALARFDGWTADAEIANSAITLKQSQMQQGARKRQVDATVTLGDQPKVTFAAPNEPKVKR